MGLKSFFQTVLLSFNPAAYEKLAERKLTHSANYFFSMVCVVFIVMFLLFIPAIVMLPDTVENELGKFSRLDIKINQSMNAPINIPKSRPQITIDSSKEYYTIEEGNLLITSGAMFYKFIPFTQPTKIVRDKDMLEKKDQLAVIASVVIMAMLPTLLAALLVYFMLKYLIVVVVCAIIAFVIARIARFGISMAEIFKVGFFASTIMVAAALLTKPFVPVIYCIEYLLFLVYFILGVIRVGSFESVVRPKKSRPSLYEH